MDLEKHFRPFIKALESGIKEGNWILSVTCACTLPDICTSLEGKRGRAVYIEWFNNYVEGYQYTLNRRKGFIAENLEEWINRPPLKPEEIELHTQVFFSGVNAYAFRCAFLHDGNGNLSSQEVYENPKYKDQILNIENVKFENAPSFIFKQVSKTAYINPEKYCKAIIIGVNNWIETVTNDEQLYSDVKENTSKLLKFE